MTVAAEVKQCLASLKNIEASLSTMALLAQDDESRQTLHEAMMTVSDTVQDVKSRVGELERQEAEYKGF